MTNIEASIPKPARRPANNRSRVGNGRDLLPMTDHRSATYRRFQDLYEDICGDLGGIAYLSEAQKQLVKMAATISAECERMVAMAMSGEKELNLAEYGAAADRVGRLLQRAISAGLCSGQLVP